MGQFFVLFGLYISRVGYILTKGITDDNIKSHKKQGFSRSLEDIFPEKPQKGVKLTPPLTLFRDNMVS